MIPILISLFITYCLLSACFMALILGMNTQNFIDSNISSMPTSWKVVLIAGAFILGFLTGPVSFIVYTTYHLCTEYTDFIKSVKEYLKND